MAPLDFRSYWSKALPWDGFFVPQMDQRSLWEGVYRHAAIPEWALDAAGRIPHLKLLVLAADWCGDAANTVPVMQRLVEQTPGAELRILRRDTYPEVMDRYLTNGRSRSIPIAILLDGNFRELDHWGPRPSELQAWLMANKDVLPKDERYLYAPRWYAKDRGETTLREMLGALKTPTPSPSRK